MEANMARTSVCDTIPSIRRYLAEGYPHAPTLRPQPELAMSRADHHS